MPPADAAQASRARHPRRSAPGAPGAAASRSTIFGEEERAGDLKPEIEQPGNGPVARSVTVSASMMAMPSGDHHVMRDAKSPGSGAGGFGLQVAVEALPAHASL